MPFIGNKPTAVPLSADDLEDNIISTAKIQDNAVTAAKFNADVIKLPSLPQSYSLIIFS